jgi:zinc finger protein
MRDRALARPSKVDMASQNLFPSIGTVAQQADDSADPVTVNDENITYPNEDEDRVVQEVESLCMNCEEQVGTQLSSC